MRSLIPFVAVAFLGMGGVASAQPPATTHPPATTNPPVKVPEKLSAGLFLGGTTNGAAERGGGGGGEADFVFDAPIASGKHHLRFDATRTSWDSREDDGQGGVMVRDRVTLTTLRVSLVSVKHHSPNFASYGGVGLGAYGYDFSRTPDTHRWRGGVHYLFGLEFLQPGNRSAIDLEVRIHAMGGPDLAPETQALMFKLDAAVGWKLRF